VKYRSFRKPHTDPSIINNKKKDSNRSLLPKVSVRDQPDRPGNHFAYSTCDSPSKYRQPKPHCHSLLPHIKSSNMTLEHSQIYPRSSRPGGSMADAPYNNNINGNGNHYYYNNNNNNTSTITAVNSKSAQKPTSRHNSLRNRLAPDFNNMGNMKSRMLNSCRRNPGSEPSSRVPSPRSPRSPPPLPVPNEKPIDPMMSRPGVSPLPHALVGGSDSSNKSTNQGGSTQSSSSEVENSSSEEAQSQPDPEEQEAVEKTPAVPKEEDLPIPKELLSVVQPLTNLHYSCYQAHRRIAMSRNVYYPVPCMTCHVVNREVRWRCTFCCLRVCAQCIEGIRSCKRRSLKEFMETLEAAA
jgi:hypothetical protein